MALDTPREAALEILLCSSDKNTTLDRILDAFEPQLAKLSQADRNLCHAIVFGVLRHRSFLDFIIQAFSKIKTRQMNLPVQFALRMALFQMRFLDRVPDFAAIDTSVELVKARGPGRTAGFVNGVLRNAARRYDTLVWPDPEKTPLDHIHIVHSIPLWLARRWLARYGPAKTLDLCRSINQIPPLTLRANTLKTSRTSLGTDLISAGYTIAPTRTSPDGIVLTGPGTRVELIPGYSQGLFQIQDEAAQLVSFMLDPQPGETVLDACAGLGGKTLHLAQLMQNTGQIIALDTDPHKLKHLTTETLRLGITNTQCRTMNLLDTGIKDFPGYFDRVLVDAPCTGLGVLRRNPDAKWRRTLQDIPRMAALQKRLLTAAANLVKPGGALVYAVCSCEPEENEQVVDAFIKKRTDYRLTLDSYFKTYPDPGDMDGFFAARLHRI